MFFRNTFNNDFLVTFFKDKGKNNSADVIPGHHRPQIT